MKRLSSIFLVFIFATALYAQPAKIDEGIKKIANEVMQDIYQDVLRAAESYNMKGFGEESLKENHFGFLQIDYDYQKINHKENVKPYAFGLSIVPMDEDNYYVNQEGSFSYGFPLLNIKFIGYMKKTLRRKQFDINTSIQRYGRNLWTHQQEFMPMKLFLVAKKKIYDRGEDIDFTVKLVNVSRRSIIVRDLNEKTLFFVYNDQIWGAKESNPLDTRSVKEVILEPQESITKTFIGRGFAAAKEVEIFCSYSVTHKSVQPSANLKVQVR